MTVDQGKIKSIETIGSLIAKNLLPGIQYMVVDQDRELFSHATGQAVIGGDPMSLATPMMLYSATKVFTTVALLQMVDQGKLDLDDPLEKYLPVPYHDVSVRQVLTHSSGIPNPVIGNMYIHSENQAEEFDPMPLLKKTLSNNQKLKFPPDRKFMYSNLGFALLGELIEKLSQKSYEAYVRENILNKLGILGDQASFSFKTFNTRSRGYVKRFSLMNLLMSFLVKELTPKTQGRWKTFEEHWCFNHPSHGGLIVCAPAIAVFLQDQLKQHSVLLSNDLKQELYRIQRPAKSRLIGSTDIALGWFYNREVPEPYYFHEGSAFGYVAEMRIYPQQKIASVLLANTTRFPHKRLMTEIDNHYFK